MPRYLDPSNDYVFKVLFKDPGDERRLIAMLTAILEPDSPIVSAKVLNPQIEPDVATAKSIVLDILVRLADGRSIGIEMEAWPRRVFVDREVYYWSCLHSKQLDAGESHSALRSTIAIAWLGNPRDGSRGIVDSERVHTRYRICETTTKRELTDHLEIHLLDLRNLASDGMLSPALRRWAEFFDHPTEAVLARLAAEDEIMADTITKLEAVSADDQAYYIAEARRMGAIRDALDRTYERDHGRAEGRAEGLATGVAYVVVAVLEARFGTLASAVRARIESAPVDDLMRLAAKAGVIASPDELFDS